MGARLADEAGVGEIVASLRLSQKIVLETDDLEHQSLDLRGQTDPVDAKVITDV